MNSCLNPQIMQISQIEDEELGDVAAPLSGVKFLNPGSRFITPKSGKRWVASLFPDEEYREHIGDPKQEQPKPNQKRHGEHHGSQVQVRKVSIDH